MLKFLVNRLLQTVVALLAILTVTFLLIRLAPGGPFTSERALPAHIEAKTIAALGLDDPLPVQWLKSIGNFFTGFKNVDSFGNFGFTVAEILQQGLPVSLTVGAGGLLIALLIGIPIGVIAASRKNTALDYSLMSLALVGICLPTFVIGPALSILFGLHLRWFNALGWNGPTDWFLPSLTLGLYYSAYIARLARGGMLETLSQDFIRTARAKGVPEHRILVGHALRGGLLPVVTFMGPAIASLVTGSFVVETIFHVPGLGMHFINAAVNRDHTLIFGTVSVYATLILVMNFLVDIALSFLNPRLRAEAAEA